MTSAYAEPRTVQQLRREEEQNKRLLQAVREMLGKAESGRINTSFVVERCRWALGLT